VQYRIKIDWISTVNIIAGLIFTADYTFLCCSQQAESDNEFEAPEPKSVGRSTGRRQKNASAGGETTAVSLCSEFRFTELYRCFKLC